MLKIYHNPNCSKSHQAITIFANSNTDFVRILHGFLKLFYMQIYRQKLIGRMMMYTGLLKKAGGDIHIILRPSDTVYKQESLDNSDDEKYIATAIQYPSVIERPLIKTNDTVFAVRPPKKLQYII